MGKAWFRPDVPARLVAALALGAGCLGVLRADAATPAPPTASAVSPAAVPAPPSAPAPLAEASPAGLIAALALDVDSGHGLVEGRLGSLDGGPLTLALRRAVRRGRKLLLVLDPDDAQSCFVGKRLKALAPGRVRLRWAPGLRFKERLLRVDAVGAWAWKPGGVSLEILAPALALARFKAFWASAHADLPQALVLRDALKALPDPRDEDPHYTRRAAGPSAP